MEIRVGTSGYAYKEWRGSFYPEKLKPALMLGYYSERFSTVEINNTFYKLPERQTLERWAEQVPAGFVFVLKASQRITHRQRLAPEQPGFLGIESVRDPSGLGITVSYWRDEQSIAAWKRHAVHTSAQEQGRAQWYVDYALRVARVERAYTKATSSMR